MVNPGAEGQFLDPEGMLGSENDSGNGEVCHFGVDGSHIIHVIGVVMKSNMSDIGTSMSNHISHDFLVLVAQAACTLLTTLTIFSAMNSSFFFWALVLV